MQYIEERNEELKERLAINLQVCEGNSQKYENYFALSLFELSKSSERSNIIEVCVQVMTRVVVCMRPAYNRKEREQILDESQKIAARSFFKYLQ